MAVCKPEHNRAWKARNPNWRDARKQKAEEILTELKSHPCVDCGGSFPVECVDFDHLPGTKKVMGVSTMVRQGLSRQRIEDEVAKCELVCANCHRIRTRKRARAHLEDEG